MKTIKFLLAALLLTLCGTIAQAQSVIVYKSDGTQVKYNASEVKDVKYKKAYYYYAGWTCPTNEEELATLAVAPNGGEVDMSKTYSSSNVLYDYTMNGITGNAKAQIYVVVPKGISIYDADKESALNYYTVEGTIGEHTIYKSVKAFSTIDYIILF